MKKLIVGLLLSFCLQVCFAQQAVELSRLKLSIAGGYAYRIGKKPEGQYFKDISHGPTFATDLSYFFNELHGVGVKYSSFYTEASGATSGINILSNVRINFFGALYKVRPASNNKRLETGVGIGLGYMNFRDKGWIEREPGTIKGGSLGGLLEAGLDYRIIKGLSAGINLSLYSGYLSEVSRNGVSVKLEGENRESLSRVEGAIGLSYSF